MEATGNRSESCVSTPLYVVGLAAIDLFTFALGQPVILRLLWLGVTSRRPVDLLNLNLAGLHNLQNLLALTHFMLLLATPELHTGMLKVMLVYSQIGGPSNLCFISVERYVAVIHATSYHLLKKYRWREVCVAIVWMVSITPAILVAFPLEQVPSFSTDGLKMSALGVMVSMTLIMLWCSHAITHALRRSGPGKDRLHPVKRRAFITVSATIIITMTLYIPVAGMQLQNTWNERMQRCVIAPLCVLLLSAASVVHPLFYLHTQGQLPCCRGRPTRAQAQ